MRGGTGRLLSLVVVGAVGLGACGSESAEPLNSYSSVSVTTVADSSSSSPDVSTSTSAVGGEAGQPLVREMTVEEWSTLSALQDEMVCPEPDMKAGDQFWDYSGDVDPSEYGRQSGDALADAITEMNDQYRRETGQSDGFLEEAGWTGLTHGDEGIIYFVFPETDWQHIVTVTGDPSTGAWRHQKATVCVTVP